VWPAAFPPDYDYSGRGTVDRIGHPSVCQPSHRFAKLAEFPFLFFFTSVLSILSNNISRRDLVQIDRQTDELSLGEAQLRKLSNHDHLTGLFNRRFLEETLVLEIWQSLRSHTAFGVILFDIDHFKQVWNN